MIKKIIFGLSALALASVANAGVTYPSYLRSDFVINDGLSADWLTYGVTATPILQYQDIFKDPINGPWYDVMQPVGAPVGAFSCSAFQNLAKSDQWLISPEFRSEFTKLMYSFTAVSYAASANSNFQLYAGAECLNPEDFKKNSPVMSGVVEGVENGYKTMSQSGRFDVLAEEDMRVAFVNSGNRSGLLGFADIIIAPYLIEVKDQLKLNGVIIDQSNPTLSFTIRISTPELCEGVTAILKTKESNISSTFKCTNFISFGTYSEIDVVFPDKIDLGDLASDEFTVTLAPNYENAPETIITGTLVGSMNLYEPVAVVEDMTGTWCNNCPRAIALMDYFHGEYPRKNGRPQFIGIAAHGSSTSIDPMEDPAYMNGIKSAYVALTGAAQVGFPTFVKNRKSAVTPTANNYHIFPTYLNDILNKKTNAEIKITAVEYDNSDPAQELATVRFEVRAALEGESNFNASVVVIENNVVGNNSSYNQQNSMSMGANLIANYFGSGAYDKYFAKYDNKGTIGYKNMSYQEVARGAYPSFAGTKLMSPFQFNTPSKYHITFQMPNVAEKKNVEMIVLLTDRSSGEIISADIRPYNYTAVGVEEVNEDFGDAVVQADGGFLKVYASNPGMISVYALDGRTLYVGSVDKGYNAVALDYSGMLIVRLNTEGVQRTSKLIM